MCTVFALVHSADGLQRGLGRSGRCAKSANGSAGARKHAKHRPWRLGSSTRSTRNTSPRSKPTYTRAGPLTLPHAHSQSGKLALTARNGFSSRMRAVGSGCVSMQCSTGPWRRGTLCSALATPTPRRRMLMTKDDGGLACVADL